MFQCAQLNPKTVIENEAVFQEFKGALTEQYVLQELVASGVDTISYWTNDAGSAEVDFIFEYDGRFVPLEVKATENLQSKSLRVFRQKHPDIHCFRASLSNFREEEWLTNVPLYSAGQMYNFG